MMSLRNRNMATEAEDLKNLNLAVKEANFSDIIRFSHNNGHNNSVAHYNILKTAISTGQTTAAKLLIKRGFAIKIKEDNELLHWAIEAGNLELVQILVKKRVSTTALDKDGLPPFFKVAHVSSDCNKFLNCLVPNFCTKFGVRFFTILHYAAEKGNVALISTILNNIIDYNIRAGDGSTALHIAVKNRHTEVVKILLERGLKDPVVNANKMTPLSIAIENGDFEIFEILLNFNRKTQMEKTVYLINQVHQDLFALATRAGNLKILEILKSAVNRKVESDETAFSALSIIRLADVSSTNNHSLISLMELDSACSSKSQQETTGASSCENAVKISSSDHLKTISHQGIESFSLKTQSVDSRIWKNQRAPFSRICQPLRGFNSRLVNNARVFKTKCKIVPQIKEKK